jgi:hypothetical protein
VPRPLDADRGPVAGAPSELLDPEELGTESTAPVEHVTDIDGWPALAAWLKADR